MKDFDRDEIYMDQSINIVDLCDRNFISAFTPYGISQLDSEFCKRIRDIKTKKEKEKLEIEILENKNLHSIIKDNLLMNLNQIWINIKNKNESQN